MPAMHFHLRWPDQRETRCYSPSLVIKDHFAPGERYAVAEFLCRMREAMHTASERVREKFGFACSLAQDQLAQIESIAARFEPDDEVHVLRFED